MSRNIPINLLNHKKQSSTTLCWLIKIEGKKRTIGLTTLDKNIIYFDGFDNIEYQAPVGFEPANIASTSEAGVDTSEFQALYMPAYEDAINEYEVNAGEFDYAKFIIYEVNYEDLTQGHMIVMSGHLGQMRTINGMSIFGELRSLMDNYRKQVCQLDSRTCRAKFGSQIGEERQPCGFDISSLWESHAVTNVGLENTRTFISNTIITDEADKFVPGLIRFTSGDNIGRSVEIESQSETGEITLKYTTPYIIKTGDQFEIREDCNKFATDEKRGCKKWFGDQWPLKFRGEPNIPVGDEAANMSPAVNSPTTIRIGVHDFPVSE